MAKPSGAEVSGEGKRILLVDDDADFRSMLQAALELAGYPVNSARNGKEAQSIQRSALADILITDIFMPERDGFEVIEAFRKEFPRTRIIAISGGTRVMKTDYLATAELIGVDAALQKPFDVEELLDLLRKIAR
jgi:CheY-like chemotaxis protein